MDDLSRAVAQFLPHVPGPEEMSGGFNLPPTPEGSSALPLLTVENENLNQPGPSAALEREGRAVRDLTPELRMIDNLKHDPLFKQNEEQIYITIEEIIIFFKKLIIPNNHVSNNDIRNGVEAHLATTMEVWDPYLRKRKLLKILREVTDLGSESSHFVEIIKQIESISGGPL